MKKRRYIAVFLCLIILSVYINAYMLLPAPENAEPIPSTHISDKLSQSLLDAASICHKIYLNAPPADTFNVVLSSQTISEMMNAVGEAGYSVIDEQGKFDMVNPDPILRYGQIISEGDFSAQTVYYTIYSDGHIGAAQLSGSQLRSLSADFTNTPAVYLDITTPLKDIQFTEKGWLIYQRDLSSQNSSKPFNTNEYTMVRISPLSEHLRTLCETYIAPIGYSENNLFTVNWTENDPQELDLASVYAMLFGLLHDGEVLNWYSAKQYYSQVKDSELFLIPREEFESVIQTFLNIPTAAIRSIPEYNAAEQGYYFLGWQTGYYSVIPRIPTPEVINVRTNPDGTLTLVTDAIFSWYGSDCAFRHETTVRLNDNGTFQFVKNHVVAQENNMFPTCLIPTHREGAILGISK